MSFNIIRDTREQHPWDFASASIKETIVKKLDTGDYSIEGLEDVLCIERKGSLVEFYGNITQDRFWNEMERMKMYEFKFVIIEANLKDVMNIPYSLNVPKAVWSKFKISPKFMLRQITRMEIDYGINVIFAGDTETAVEVATSIMKRVYENKLRPI